MGTDNKQARKKIKKYKRQVPIININVFPMGLMAEAALSCGIVLLPSWHENSGSRGNMNACFFFPSKWLTKAKLGEGRKQ